jgi:hypothetical protein
LAAVQSDDGHTAAGAIFLRTSALAKGALKEMFWSQMKLVLAAILTLGLAGAGVVVIGYGIVRAADDGKAQAQKGPAAKVTLKGADLDDIASILHIYKQSCTVQFLVPIKKATLKLEFYKAGRLMKQPVIEAGTFSAADDEDVGEARFSLQVADLDYLPLAGGKKGSSRFQMNFQVDSAKNVTGGRLSGTSGSSGGADISKDVFDLSFGNSAGKLNSEPGSTTEIPLFYVLANTTKFISAETVTDLVAKNDKADILIVSLVTPK